MSLRSLWSSTTVVIKPWTGGIAWTDDGKFVTASIPHIADRIGKATEDPGLATQYTQERESSQQRTQHPSQPE